MKNKQWCCSVCMYLHLGESPPDFCPLCGATAELFELSVPVAQAPVEHRPSQWRCLNCDFIHDGDAPPDNCPLCGVGPDQFEAVEQKELKAVEQSMTGHIVIIGGGIAGLSAAEAARNSAPEAKVTLVTLEPVLPYYRLNLTRYLAGEITLDDLPVHSESWYSEHDITVLTGTEVASIDRASKKAMLKGGRVLEYDKLVLAMGAHPSVPPVAGAHRKKIMTLRTCRDAEEILEHCSENAQYVIIGGGVLGLETAAALSRRKAKVTLIEGFDWLLPRQLNRAAGICLAGEAEALGISLVCGGRIKELDGDDTVRSVILESGEIIPADVVIIAAGVRSNSYIARLAGLEVNGGIVVDQHLQTSDPDIYAAGDLAEHQGMLYGTWVPAQFQGKIAGANAAGGTVVFDGIPRSNSLKVLGVDLFSIGHIHPDDASYQIFEKSGEQYDFFVFRDSRLVGAILIGDTTIAPVLKKMIESHFSCSELLAAATDVQHIRAGLADIVVSQ